MQSLELMPNLPSLFPDCFLSANNGEHTQTLYFLKAIVMWFYQISCVDNSDQATFLNMVFLIGLCVTKF